MENEKLPLHLFENIALCFSGGGFRAAGYSLGILSYYNHVKLKGETLLSHVKGLSTVSGGTITGVSYANSLVAGETFDKFKDRLYQFLDKTDLLEVALLKLSDDVVWENSHKKRSLINAFAFSYKELVGEAEFGLFKKQRFQLENITFNATDCSYGLAFRFTNTGKFGNYRLYRKDLTSLSGQMKLADIIAASSCFPLGFEPIIMPDDFLANHSDDCYKNLKSDSDFANGVGLMDGGIVDNQGIGSIRLSDNNRGDNKFDFIMVCDVSSYIMSPWEASVENVTNKKSMNRNLRFYKEWVYSKVKQWWWVVTPFILLVVCIIFSNIYKPLLQVSAGALLVISLIALIIKCKLIRYRNSINRSWEKLVTSKFLPDPIKNVIGNFEVLRLQLLKRMLIERATSGLKMVNEMFLKQIRRLNYDLFYKDVLLKHRRSSAMIYELTKKQYEKNESDEKGEEAKLCEIPSPGSKIYEISKQASEFGTTLWFTEEDRKNKILNKLIICGQFTACYNLLKYCFDLKKDKVDVDQQLLQDMTEAFMDDWLKFIKDPYWLHSESFK